MKYGASLIDPDKCPELIPPASVPNGRSVTTEAVYPLVTQQILDELANDHYIQYDTPPKIVSALSAIPKPDGNIRLIHDMSHPDGLSVNAYASKDPCKYQTIADALALIQPSWFMAVLDLKYAYRSIHIRDSEHCLTGLSWKFPGDSTPTFLFDSRLPFGSRKSPAIFNRFTQAVARIMRHKGHNIVVYLDDFWLCGPNFEACKAALDYLVSLLRTLGFQINWKKIIDPCQKLAFLRIMIDTVSGELSLKPDKLMELIDHIKKFLGRKWASRRQLEQLAGKHKGRGDFRPCIFCEYIFGELAGCWWNSPLGDIASTRGLLGRLLAECLVMDGQLVIHDQPVCGKLLLGAFGGGNVDPWFVP